ncbi:MAG: heavy metal translocating P-type ATPase [Lachnospiraceae bacterium]|nr:heavy metal translocating P-type ATPase [Lachnospiraceae bacterium]
MKYTIKHEIKGRLRVHLARKRLSYAEADILNYYLNGFEEIQEADVYERTADAVIRFSCARERAVEILKQFSFSKVEVPESVLESSGREQTAGYYERIVSNILIHLGTRLFLPAPLDRMRTCLRGLRFLWRGLKTIPSKRLAVELLDSIAIGASIANSDCRTASGVMFLLDIGDTLEEWTHKRSIDDLARRMSLNVDRVWLLADEGEVETEASDVSVGDRVVVRMGTIIPFDGTVTSGDAMINEASMTGESLPVHKAEGAFVFAGTVVEEGEIVVSVTKTSGCGRFDAIVKMIEESEKLKSSVEGRAERLADRLVPYTLLASGATFAWSRNVSKAISVLMVDYSCALKMTMPISVLSAIREAADYRINVKGGRFLEAVAQADTIVFDKTGTLTKATPRVVRTVSFCDETEDELLRQAACLEEHFPHSVAKAVVEMASEKGLMHEEMHTKLEYIVAHGIASHIDGKRVVIGSYHFVFEDEGAVIPDAMRGQFDELPDEYSHLYFAKEGQLCACILIEDPLRDEAASVVAGLREQGFSHLVMLNGDSERTAARIARQVGISEYYAEVLPEDKASYIEKARHDGRCVVMVGDGINDSPALSASDVGIAISEGAEIARQIADITISSAELSSIVALRELAVKLMNRIQFNYHSIAGFNTALIVLGMLGILPPATSALLHNGSTIALGLNAMTPLTPQ